LKKPFYPTASLDLEKDMWVDRNINITERGLDMIDFMDYSNYSAVISPGGFSLYTPLLDPLGPYFFYP
jgi:hypothetical protein